FAFRLIVPEAGRARLPERDNPLDADARRGDEDVGNLAGPSVRQIAEQIHPPAAASAPATARRQPATRSLRSASSIAGVNERAACQRAIISSGAGQSPRARPAT